MAKTNPPKLDIKALHKKIDALAPKIEYIYNFIKQLEKEDRYE